MRRVALFFTIAVSTAIQASPTYTTYNYVTQAIERATSNTA